MKYFKASEVLFAFW